MAWVVTQSPVFHSRPLACPLCWLSGVKVAISWRLTPQHQLNSLDKHADYCGEQKAFFSKTMSNRLLWSCAGHWIVPDATHWCVLPEEPLLSALVLMCVVQERCVVLQWGRSAGCKSVRRIETLYFGLFHPFPWDVCLHKWSISLVGYVFNHKCFLYFFLWQPVNQIIDSEVISQVLA